MPLSRSSDRHVRAFAVGFAAMLAVAARPAATVAAPSLCATFSAGDVGTSVGTPVTNVSVRIRASDRWTCTYTTAERIVSIDFRQYGSPSEAAHDLVESVAGTSNLMHQPMQKIHGTKDLMLLLGQTLHVQHGSRTITIADIGGSTGEEVAIAQTAR